MPGGQGLLLQIPHWYELSILDIMLKYAATLKLITYIDQKYLPLHIPAPGWVFFGKFYKYES